MDGSEYIITPARKYMFLMLALQSTLRAENLFMDVTYTSNNFLPYFLKYFNFQQSNVLITWSQEYCAVDLCCVNTNFDKVSHYHGAA